MKKYKTCVKELERLGLTRRGVAALVGVHESVLSRRMAGKQEPTFEANTVINTLRDVFARDLNELEAMRRVVSGSSQLGKWVLAATELREVGSRAA